jgi:hypothetical protein
VQRSSKKEDRYHKTKEREARLRDKGGIGVGVESRETGREREGSVGAKVRGREEDKVERSASR